MPGIIFLEALNVSRGWAGTTYLLVKNTSSKKLDKVRMMVQGSTWFNKFEVETSNRDRSVASFKNVLGVYNPVDEWGVTFYDKNKVPEECITLYPNEEGKIRINIEVVTDIPAGRVYLPVSWQYLQL